MQIFSHIDVQHLLNDNNVWRNKRKNAHFWKSI
jgi:hypothetical protein